MSRATGARLLRTRGAIRTAVDELARERGSIGFVPTMGALHEGHLSLVGRAREEADVVVLSIFVNPMQFGPDEDYEAYPRTLEEDLRVAGARGVDLVFAPTVEEMYPVPQRIQVDPGPLAERLCGASRPGHFRGVLTVVLKLLHLVRPSVLVMGRKDLQQAVLVGRMLEQFCLPVRLVAAPIVREPDGLAMSSRNRYLSAAERETALSLPRALRRVREAYAAGEGEGERLGGLAAATMREAGAEVEYAEVVDPVRLQRVGRAGGEDVCAVAARVGGTRLIDNARLAGPEGP